MLEAITSTKTRVFRAVAARLRRFLGLRDLHRAAEHLRQDLDSMQKQVDDTKFCVGQLLADQLRARLPIADLSTAEFRVFSQFGEDGIIQCLTRQLEIEPHVFVEFGVQDYTEANTRFLLQKDNWTGLVMDGNAGHVRRIHASELYWRHELKAICAFIDRDNINQLLAQAGFSGPIGLLSVDIDGNDYWVWEAIDVVDPTMVICEYNSVFGPQHAITVPYDARFRREDAHFSHLYWGASLKALATLAESKGYSLVGSNSAGNNAFFVKRSWLGSRLASVSAEQAYRRSKFRESRDERGRLSFLQGAERLRAIRQRPVYDILKDRTAPLEDYLDDNG